MGANWLEQESTEELTETENSQAANVCITAVEGHSSEVLGIILILFFTITIIKLLMMGMVMTVRGGKETPNSTHKVTTERATITLISFGGRASTTKGEDTKEGERIYQREMLLHCVSYFFGILKHFSGAVGEGVGDGLEEKRRKLVMLALLHSAVPIKPENKT